jgi:PKHD-type hydroxylase
MGSNRKLSFSLLLNDDYEGGELEIPGSPGQEDVFVPVRNTAIFFPSSMPHCVKPVTKGIRKSLVGWVHGPNFV